MVGWKSFSGNEFKDRWTSKRFNLELSDLSPELGWYVLRYGDKYYKNMPPKIPDLELVLLSNSDKWEDSFKVYVKYEYGQLTMMCESEVPDYINDDLVGIVMEELENNRYLGSVLDTWDSMSGRRSFDGVVVKTNSNVLGNKINEISARLPGYLSGGIIYNYDRP